MKYYYVYVLIFNTMPVYVGCTTNMYRRILRHEKDKKFDSYYVIEKFKNKKEALSAERCIIHFYAMFRKHKWYNKENVSYIMKRHFSDNFSKLKEYSI